MSKTLSKQESRHNPAPQTYGTRGDSIVGRFHELKVKGQKQAPEFVICKQSEAERYKGDNYDKYLHAKYTEKLLEKNVEFDRKRADSETVTEADRHYFEEAVQEYQENFLGTLEPKTQKEYNRYIEY